MSSLNELTRVGSSLFVAVYESLFHVRLDGVARNPKSRESYAINVQRVIDSLSRHISMDLRHIRGRAIVQGDLRALSNLVHIFIRIVAIQETQSEGEGDGEGEGLEDRFATGGVASQDVDSISTHESTFGEGDAHNDERNTPENSRRVATLSKVRRLWQLDARQLLNTTEAQLQQDADLEQRRRQRRSKSSSSSPSGLRRDRGVGGGTGEHVMLRKIYSSILGRMTQIESSDQREFSEKVRRLADETKAYIQSLHNEMGDRIEMLRQQLRSVVSTEDRHSDAQARIAIKLRTAYAGRMSKMAASGREHLLEERQQLLLKGREAHRSLVALKSAESAEVWQPFR